MKRIILIISLILSTYGNAQILEQENFVVDGGVGFPNLSYFRHSVGNNIFHSGNFGQNNTNINRSIGQFYINAEFLLTDDIGFTAGINYGHYYNFNTRQQTVYENNSSYTQSYYYKERINKLRYYFGINYHTIKTERLDSYFSFKACFKKTIINYESDDPYADSGYYFEFPVGFRLAYGLRYFINDNFGLTSELGLGGPLITIGASYKLN